MSHSHLNLPYSKLRLVQNTQKSSYANNSPEIPFLYEQGVARGRKTTVVIVGCGGLGSWVAVMLVRSGVAHQRLIDFDYVTLFLLQSSCQKYKQRQGVFLHGCWHRSDPTRIQIANLFAIHYDPLARAVRQRLRAVFSRSERSSPLTPRSSDPSSADADADDDPTSAPSPTSSAREYSIPVVYSSEVPSDDVTLLPLANSELAKGSVDELAPLRDFRVRNLPVLGPLPAIFGLLIATYVLCELAGRRPNDPCLSVIIRSSTNGCGKTSWIASKQINSLPLTTGDIALLYDDFALGRSIVPPNAVCVRPALVRWDPRPPLSLENCVVGEMKEVSRAMSRVFSMLDADAVADRSRSVQEWGSLSGAPRRFGASMLLVSGQQFRIAQARRFREWALQ
ncbi:hypothetical protein BGW80DRAFT_1559946 [Lactifluus volemus]|nr:hypothetical protein BGW80DRAFT_1559946 [Lactifluus volemus]